MKDFAHLHVHTEYSLLDGASRIKNLVKKVKERGWSSVAITDHGNMYGVLQFYQECLANNVKPIIGTEFYICEDINKKQGKADLAHILIIAKNNTGYQNLIKLNSIGYVKGFYYKPRIDYKLLQQYSEGLICLSGCLGAHIPSLIVQRRFDEAKQLALKLKNMFAPGDFYLELQNHGIPEQKEVLNYLVQLSKEIEVKLVATNDVHYTERQDAEVQDVLLCVQMGKQLDDPDRMKFDSSEFYLKTYEEMLQALPGMEQALDNTLEIANKCNVVIQSKSHGGIKGVNPKYVLAPNQNHIPVYQTPNGEDSYEYMRKLTYQGINKLYKQVTQEVIDRTEMELETIRSQGFVDYFLVVWDYVNYAKQNSIPVGPGRGSGAGSIVAYALGITMVDPLKYGLIFERFINKERISMPDFDIDFCYDRRGEVIDYVRQRYTDDNVAMIITFGTMAAKNALRDVARVLRMPISQVDRLAKQIPNKLPDGIKRPPVLAYYFGQTGDAKNDKYILPELKKAYDEDEFVKRVVDFAIKLEGTPRNTSIHAAGVIIAPSRVDDFVPLSKNGDEVATQFNMIELESLGLLKMDFLGLRTLTDIDKAVKTIKKTKGIEIDFYNMEYDDPKVYELISSGDTEAIFQLEGSGMKKFMKDLKPTCLEDIIAGVSLYRPGPMDSIPRYIDGKRNPEHIVYAHPMLEDVLDVTYGCIVYQEQVMKIFQIMGGYSFAQADNVRRIMSKKQLDKMEIERNKFIYGEENQTDPSKSIPGALKLGVSEQVATQVFNEMESFASYAFNKSHAAAYSFISYQTAYLKCYYEVEFMAAVINNRITNLDEIKKYVLYCKKQNIDVLPPSINKSKSYFSVENKGLRFGLAGLKNVGVAVINLIVEERERNGEFKDFEDFAKRVDSSALNKRCLESLILSGAFDEFGKHRSQLMCVFEQVVDKVTKERKSKASGQFSIFDFANQEIQTFDNIEYPNVKPYNKETELKLEKEVMGIYISGHPLDDYKDRFDDYNLTSDMLVEFESEDMLEQDESQMIKQDKALEDGMKFVSGGIITEVVKKTTKSNREMAFITLEDLYGTMEMMVFPNILARYKQDLVEDKMATITGKVSLHNDSPTLVVDKIIFWDNGQGDQQENALPTSNKVCYIQYDSTDENLSNNVIKTLEAYPGTSEVIIKCSKTQKVFKLNKLVDVCSNLINDLIGLIKQENVVVRERKN